MNTTLFELQSKTVCRLSSLAALTPSLEIIDTEDKGMVKIMGITALKEIRDRLDKFIYMLDAMEIDGEASEMHVSDLYGNNISIKYALEHDLLKRRCLIPPDRTRKLSKEEN